jgi:hypothetical protein
MAIIDSKSVNNAFGTASPTFESMKNTLYYLNTSYKGRSHIREADVPLEFCVKLHAGL